MRDSTTMVWRGSWRMILSSGEFYGLGANKLDNLAFGFESQRVSSSIPVLVRAYRYIGIVKSVFHDHWIVRADQKSTTFSSQPIDKEHFWRYYRKTSDGSTIILISFFYRTNKFSTLQRFNSFRCEKRNSQIWKLPRNFNTRQKKVRSLFVIFLHRSTINIKFTILGLSKM